MRNSRARREKEASSSKMIRPIGARSIGAYIVPRNLSFDASWTYRGGLANKMENLITRLEAVKMLERFKQSVFHNFIPAIERWQFGGMIIHHLFMHMVYSDRPDELHFRFSGTPCQFGRRDFAMYCGLQFGPVGPVGEESMCLAEGTYLHQHKGPITVKILEAAMLFEKDKEIVYRIGLVYFIYVILNGQPDNTGMPREFFYSVEDLDGMATYPWGQLLWDNFLANVWDVVRQIESYKINDESLKRISVGGWICALQYFAYDILPDLVDVGGYATRINDFVPRMLRWTCATVPPRIRGLKRSLTDNPRVVDYLDVGEDDATLLRGIGFTEEEITAATRELPDPLPAAPASQPDVCPPAGVFRGPVVDTFLPHASTSRIDPDASSSEPVHSVHSHSELEALFRKINGDVIDIVSELKEHKKTMAGQSRLIEDQGRLIEELQRSNTCQVNLVEELRKTVTSLPVVQQVPSVQLSTPLQSPHENSSVLSPAPAPLQPEIPISFPSDGILTKLWVFNIMNAFEWGSGNVHPSKFPSVLPVEAFDRLVLTATDILHKEPNCVRIDPQLSPSSKVVVVGDIHGQVHDLLFLLRDAGYPGDDRVFVFNGDYVDRGAWGLETFLLLLAWKVLLPDKVFLLRGNHETKYCTSVYGFKKEVLVKYGGKGGKGKHVYRKCLGCFEALPLASIIAGNVYTAHGGVFRSVPVTLAPVTLASRRKGKKRKGKKRKVTTSSDENCLSIGSLDELSKAKREVLDPSWEGSNVIPGDVLWSDPCMKPGLSFNEERGIGLMWGPDCTEDFLKKCSLKLIIRSHEGPDAREKRSDLCNMNEGYTIDHVVDSGRLVTVFSAPDYPQFQDTEDRYNNKGAYVVLEHPNYDTPVFRSFEAFTPRPKVGPYYVVGDVMDSDVELDFNAMHPDSGSKQS